MKFLVLFVATLAFASASLFGPKKIDIKEDGTIVITGENGKQIAISKKFGLFGPKDIEIEVSGPNTVGKKIQIGENNQVKIEKELDNVTPENYDFVRSFEEDRNKRASTVETQDIAIRGFLNDYLTVVDEASYQKLFTKVQKAVTKGKVNSTVLDFIQALHEESKWDNMLAGQPTNTVGLKKPLVNTIFGQPTVDDLLKQYNEKYGQPAIMENQPIYNQFTEQLLTNVLVKIFDKQYLYTLLNQQGVFEQGLYTKPTINSILNNILIEQGIFDKEVLIQLVNDAMLRKILVEQGIFNESVLEQLLYVYNTQAMYNEVLLEQLVNRQVLKYFLIKEGIFKYILGQIEKQYNIEVYGQQYVLVKLIKNPVLRNLLVQVGIFDNEVLQKLLYTLNTQGIFNQLLLNELVNKAVLRNVLVQQGIKDEAYLEKLVSNEVLGLQVLMKTKFFTQTPNLTYQQMIGGVPGVYQNAPWAETVNQRSTYDNIFDDEKVGSTNYLGNNIYGQQGLGYKQGVNQGYFYPQAPVATEYLY